MPNKRKPPLRAVSPDEKAPLDPPKTIAEAVERDERALLVALRDKVAIEIDNGVPPAYLAPVMRQLREIDKSIRSLDARDEQESATYDEGADEADFDASAV